MYSMRSTFHALNIKMNTLRKSSAINDTEINNSTIKWPETNLYSGEYTNSPPFGTRRTNRGHSISVSDETPLISSRLPGLKKRFMRRCHRMVSDAPKEVPNLGSESVKERKDVDPVPPKPSPSEVMNEALLVLPWDAMCLQTPR